MDGKWALWPVGDLSRVSHAFALWPVGEAQANPPDFEFRNEWVLKWVNGKRNVGANILVFPRVLRLAYLFSFPDFCPIIGEALYLSVESEFGTRGNIKVVTLELLQTSCQLMAVCFNVSALCRCSNLALAGCSTVPWSLPGNQPRLSTKPKCLLDMLGKEGYSASQGYCPF